VGFFPQQWTTDGVAKGMWMRRWAVVALGCAWLLLPASIASALPYEQGWSLDAAVAFSAGGATGTINPVAPAGPLLNYETDAICLITNPTPNGGNGCDNLTVAPTDISLQDWFVFTVTVTAGAIDSIGVSALFQTHDDSAGYFAIGGGDVAPQTPGSNAEIIPVDNIVIFSFNDGDGLTSGETSLPLFVGYPAGTLPTAGGGPFPAGSFQFMVAEFGTSNLQSPNGTVLTTFTIIPEPGTLALLAAGLVGLSGVSRRRRPR